MLDNQDMDRKIRLVSEVCDRNGVDVKMVSSVKAELVGSPEDVCKVLTELNPEEFPLILRPRYEFEVFHIEPFNAEYISEHGKYFLKLGLDEE